VREGRVVVAPDGAVHGTVQAESIHVAGTARGELHAEEALVLDASADVEARLQADALTIESGAAFKGEVHDGEGVLPSLDPPPSGDHLPSPVASVSFRPEAEEPDAEESEVGEFVSVWDED
jgi:hypothetical protein